MRHVYAACFDWAKSGPSLDPLGQSGADRGSQPMEASGSRGEGQRLQSEEELGRVDDRDKREAQEVESCAFLPMDRAAVYI
ncbi:hypothetical protein NDU88_006255 [Pleurodeles waltl]|uniref:Uncharacterized protein n=1 Tax=Pleurodeles waltl TaxID=8319 RepID=A0AAV7VR09_PLEWA|nr:hypothetical protein NDU88_006255 [Pleurodeles waltl]